MGRKKVHPGNMKRKRYARKRRRRSSEKAKENCRTASNGTRMRMCKGKCGYPSYVRAMECAHKRMAEGAPTLRAYRCPLCGRWHLTSKPYDRNPSHGM